MLAFALRNLLSRPVRSFLAWLGLTVAISGMVGLFSISAGLARSLDATFERIPGLIVMQPGAPVPVLSRLPVGWAEEVAALPGVRTVCREQWSRAHLIEGQQAISPPRLVFGMQIDQILRLQHSLFRDALVDGRFFTPEDIGQPSTVLSRAIADEYHKAVGDTFRVDGFDLRVIGIYETGALFADLAILVDGGTARKIAGVDSTVMSSMYVDPDGSIPTSEVKDGIRDHFRGRKATLELTALPLSDFAATIVKSLLQGQTRPDESTGNANDEGVQVHEVTEWGNEIKKYSSDMDIFLALINTIGVVIAFLSITNTMLMSVSERLVEFGVLRANGWSRQQVTRLILAESAVLGLAGGAAGCLVGWLGTHVVNWWLRHRIYLYASPVLLVGCLMFSLLLGMLGGLYPAWWSVQRSPMDAIRRG